MIEEENELRESPRRRLSAFLLCFFFGWAGWHRLYCNKLGTAYLMLITMGGFGMWWFLDLVMIALGFFKDKDNLPVKRWI